MTYEGVDCITSTSGTHAVSPLVAGVIGAIVALAVAAILLVGIIFFRRGRQSSKSSSLASIADRSPKVGPLSGELMGTASKVESDGSSETDRKS